MTRTITARYPGICRSCRSAFPAGATIVYAGRGSTSHPECTGASAPTVDDELGRVLAADRRAARSGISVTRNYQGDVIGYQRSGGRCEDAPCCGCCS